MTNLNVALGQTDVRAVAGAVAAFQRETDDGTRFVTAWRHSPRDRQGAKEVDGCGCGCGCSRKVPP